MTTAANLNVMIQTHIDGYPADEYTWHSGVYLQETNAAGCNWNVEVNCNESMSVCGATISGYLDAMRAAYIIPANDATADAAYTSSRTRHSQAHLRRNNM